MFNYRVVYVNAFTTKLGHNSGGILVCVSKIVDLLYGINLAFVGFVKQYCFQMLTKGSPFFIGIQIIVLPNVILFYCNLILYLIVIFW